MPEKKLLPKRIFRLHKYPNYSFRIKDLPTDLQPDDVIQITIDEQGYYSENNSWDPFATLEIYRDTLETDEQFERRVTREERERRLRLEDQDKRDRETYERLKKKYEQT